MRRKSALIASMVVMLLVSVRIDLATANEIFDSILTD